jgi:transposase
MCEQVEELKAEIVAALEKSPKRYKCNCCDFFGQNQ